MTQSFIFYRIEFMSEKNAALIRTHLPGFYKTLFSLALPITLQNLMQVFVNMLDTIMVGQLGAAEIASVGLGNQIYFILNMILFGTSSGGAIFISQFWGKNDIKGIQKTLGIMLGFSIFVSIVFTIAALFIPEFLISLYSKDPVVILYGAKYLRYVAISYIFLAISFPFEFAFKSTNHAYLPMICTTISIILNAVFNYIFIFGLKTEFFTIEPMGVAGAAIGTVISRAAGTSVLLIYSSLKKFEILGSLKNYFPFSKKFVLKYISVALPVLLNETAWGMGITFQNSIFAHTGTDAIAAFNITGTISQLTWVFFIGTGNAAGIILGKKIGAGNFEEAKLYTYRFAWFLPSCAALIGLFLYPLSSMLPYIFNVDPSILLQAKKMLTELICFYPFNAFCMFFIVGFCRAGGDTKYAAFHDIFWMWFIAIPAGYIAAFIFHLPPNIIYLCLLSEGFLKTFAGLLRLKSGKWLKDITN